MKHVVIFKRRAAELVLFVLAVDNSPFLFVFFCYPDSFLTHLIHAVCFDVKKTSQVAQCNVFYVLKIEGMHLAYYMKY